MHLPQRGGLNAQRALEMIDRPVVLPLLEVCCTYARDGENCVSMHLPQRDLLNAQCTLEMLDRLVILPSVINLFPSHVMCQCQRHPGANAKAASTSDIKAWSVYSLPLKILRNQTIARNSTATGRSSKIDSADKSASIAS